MGNTKKIHYESANKAELEELYKIYTRFRSGDKSALNELFVAVDNRDNNIIVSKKNKRKRMENMDNVLDAEMIIAKAKDEEKNKEEDNWLNSKNEKVVFRFKCLNKMVYNKKIEYLSEVKKTGYENGKKIIKNRNTKYYEGKYDVSDMNSIIYGIVLEVFNGELDDNNCLTLDDKKNKNSICDGVSLLQNISYFTDRIINKRAENSHLDIYEGDYLCDSDDECDDNVKLSLFDQYNLKEFMRLEGSTSRLPMYEEYLEWLKRNNVHKLFKVNACDIQAIIETIMNCRNTFVKDLEGNRDVEIAMRFVKQKKLQKMIKSRHGLNIEQGNISKDLRLIEQKLLDHLFYSLNYRIGEAEESKGIFEKESERFLYELNGKNYIKIFGKTCYLIYDKSVEYLRIYDYKGYFEIVKANEDMIVDILLSKKGKKKYDMINLLSDTENDLVDDKELALYNIADTLITHYRKREEKYINNELKDYRIKVFKSKGDVEWAADLEDDVLKMRLWSRKGVKHPILHIISKENLMVYCGAANFYICDTEDKICYCVPKDRRIISKET